ncbi:hypothetical protein C8R46DRAFT_1057494 [Mycena filopes]|nr:hypothetical protein C8R46DRAFT_1057494 [Mycena filopes]
MSEPPAQRQVSRAEYKQLEKDIQGYVDALSYEEDEELRKSTKKALKGFLKNFHHASWGVRNILHAIMNGHAESDTANYELNALWNDYLIASQIRRERRSPPSASATAPLNMYPGNPGTYTMQAAVSVTPLCAYLAFLSSRASFDDFTRGVRHSGPYTSLGRDNRTSVASASSSENYGYRQLAQPHGSGASTSQMQGTQQYPNTNPQYAVPSGQQFYASYPPTQPVNGGAGQTHSYNPQWNYTQPPNGYPF